MRYCKKCNEFKDIYSFGKNKSKKDGIDIYCKKCNAQKTKSCIKNKDKISEYNRIYRLNNSDSIKEYNKNYYINNESIIKNRISDYEKTEKSKEYKKEYRFRNKERISEYGKKYRESNKDNLREYFREYRKDKRSTDLLYKLRDILRHRISTAIKSNGFSKRNKTIDIIGCEIVEFKIYIESKFEEWMTWENYGKYNGELNYGWDIDHIIPLISAENEEELLKLCNYNNLQPLCSKVNRDIKRDKLDFNF